MINELTYAYIDESGNISSNILVVCGVVTSDSKILEKRMKIAESKIARKNKGEIKASKQSSYARRKIISNIVDSEFSIYSIIFDLNSIKNRPYNFEEIYNFAMGLLCKVIYKDYSQISFIIDKRYTNEHLRSQFNKNITDVINGTIHKNSSYDIRHEDSIANVLLRVADFAAYETYQNYKIQSPLYELLVSHVKKSIIYSDISWNKIKKESKTP